MAHQPHDICWDVLASSLTYWSPDNPEIDKPTNFYLLFKPENSKEVDRFAESFARNLEEHTRNERQKYQKTCETPKPDDIVLDDRIARKIAPTVFKWRRAYAWRYAKGVKESNQLCQHIHTKRIPGCECALPFRERKASAFFRLYDDHGCTNFYSVNGEPFFNVEVVKTLLIHGEMDPILSVCSHPYIGYIEWQSVIWCRCYPVPLGWDQLYKTAMYAYIGLNIIYCFPELWTPEEIINYRDTKLYQQILIDCTVSSSENEVPKYPHRPFFGVSDTHFAHESTLYSTSKHPSVVRAVARTARMRLIKSVPYSLRPNTNNNNTNNPDLPIRKPTAYLPHASDIPRVSAMLRVKGLPEELILHVLALAEYDTPRRRLRVPHDPFHILNREELGKYLDECWMLLVRCSMFAEAAEVEIDWKKRV
ncbi:hypothetical protein BO78DRAFT_271505, partial [Aspergillus sclerotiicarbonarius CBS 121057]